MRCFRIILGSLFFAVLSLNFVINAQEINKKLSEENIIFDIYTIPSQEKDKAKLNIYLKAPYSFFRFIKDGDNFLADYEFAVEIKSKKGSISDSKVLQEKLTVSDYIDTNSDDKFFVKDIKFDIPAGEYEVRIVITDMDIKKSIQLSKEEKVTDFWNDKIGISEIVFYSEEDSSKEKSKNIIIPEPQLNVDYNSALVVNYYLFKSDIDNRLNLNVKILPKYSKDSPVFEEKKEIIERQNVIEKRIMLFPADLEVGPYIMKIELKDDKSKKEQEVEFSILWENYPILERDLNFSIEQMKYILTDEEYDRISSENIDEKRDSFNKYWKDMDQDTTTERNEVMEEYFRRIDYADQSFYVSEKNGWESDMGKIYILYGNPDNIIKRHNLVPPYETWEYHNTNKKYVFWDEFLSGVFKIKSVYPVRR